MAQQDSENLVMIYSIRKFCSPLTFFIFALLLFFLNVKDSFSQIKKDYPPRWKKGYLDFHQISTGMGNSCFVQFPDGTNMLIDAGAINRDYLRKYPPVALFDSAQSAGSYIADYIRKCIPSNLPFQLDNVIITHFHDDHVGYPDTQSSWSEGGLYRLSGITDVGSSIPIKLILDNKWPFYEPSNPISENIIRNYQLFLLEQQKKADFRIDSFRLGNLNEVLNFRSNRIKSEVALTGNAVRGKYLKSDGSIEDFLKDCSSLNPVVQENNQSCALTIWYGRHSFFSAGDIDNQAYDSVKSVGFAEEISKNTGRISFYVAGHHAMKGAISNQIIESITPDYFIVPAWSFGHPDLEIVEFFLKNHPTIKLLSTQLHPTTRNDLTNAGLSDQLMTGGHIMIRIKRNKKTPRLFFIKP